MSLGDDLRRIAAAQKQTVRQVYRLVMNDIGNQIITSSPVMDGTFRANWLSAINTGNYSYDESKVSISNSEGRLTATTGQLDVGETFYFTNSMPYAARLEDGYSDFAPTGMVKVAVNDFPSIVENRVRQLRT